jgi:ribonuclease HI
VNNSLPEVEIYSDGACLGNPGPGGWAALLRSAGQEKELSGYEANTTNNRMELRAALEALSILKRPARVTFFTDSEYLRRGITEWLPGWRKRGWRRQGGALANSELWQALDQVISPHEIIWVWVKGHSGHPENERVDRLARGSIRKGMRKN